MHGYTTQIINLLAAILLMLSFAMLGQRRTLSLIHLYTLQGLALAGASLVLGHASGDPQLYLSALLTLALKVGLIPWILYKLVRRLDLRGDVEPLLNIPATLLLGIVLVIVAFNVAAPVSELSTSVARAALGIALACVLLSFMMMITRSRAVPQVIGFLSMENGLLFAASAATNGMPMAVELGIGLDVLVGILILGVFMFQIREQFDSLDIRHLEKLKDD
ncbi:formate hydrogenlyase [Candidimonas humi]|uniref:Formate hydrogenlyase n=1 Tax=Candidimonas humi TaxID=683355 RepID=A0ABV8P3M6_9BURK|nr:formate hydrogenlyase [Candidimonas humi]MBV6307283.1 formate hydrogenlyase [Candidimonas humi]